MQGSNKTLKMQGGSIKRLLKSWIFGLGLSLIWAPSAMAIKPGVYRIENRKILDQVDAVLIANGYCKYTGAYEEAYGEWLKKDYGGYLPTSSDCSNYDIAFGVGTDKGLYAEIYGINDQKIVNKIKNIYKTAYLKHNKKINIEVNFYHQSHAQSMGLMAWFKRPYVQLNLKEVEK